MLTISPYQLNTTIKLKEALLTCICFTIIGLLNVGMYWEERSAVVEQVTWELENQLILTRSQAVSIKKINYEFYDELTNLAATTSKNDQLNEVINKLIAHRNKKIMKILNEDQQIKWAKTCSGRLEQATLMEMDHY
jgi:predicted nucleic acid-binding OB-fold protein